LRVDGQRSPERVDPLVGTFRLDANDPQILQRRRQRKWATLVEQLHGFCEEMGVAAQQAARVECGGGNRAHVRIQRGAAFSRRHRARGQLAVIRRDRDADQLRVVGDLGVDPVGVVGSGRWG
jgi:hypothetical protein